MKMTSRILCGILATLTSVSTLAGCSTGDAGSSSVSAGGETASDVFSSAPAAGEAATLRFSWWGGDSRHEATLAALDKYTAKNPNVKIEAEYGGWDGYQQKLSTQLAGATAADIIQVDQPWMPDYAVQGDFFLDLNEYKDWIDLSGFDQKFLADFCTFDGKLTSLPTGLNGISFLANKKVMEEAGVNFGEQITWDDLLNEGKKVNAQNPQNYMINMDNGINYFVTRIYLYQLTGKPLINDDYTIGVTKEELAKAYDYTLKLYEEKVVLPLEESMLFKGSSHDNPGWNNSQYGGWFNWASTANLQTWGDDAVALPYPILADAKQSGYIVRPASLFAVAKSTKAPEAAVKFLDYLYNDEEAIETLKDCRSVPATEKARALLSDKGLVNKVVVDSVNLAMANVGEPESALSGQAEVTGVFTNVFEKLIYKQYDVNAAVDETFVLLEDVLANLKASRS